MSGIRSESLIGDFRRMLTDRWGYIPGSSGQVWTKADQDRMAAKDKGVAKYGAQWIGHHVADCSGAFVWAYRQRGLRIYHGSNRIAREYVIELLPPECARPGMAAFKLRRPGDQLYALPDEYRPGGRYYTGDLNDYYHIGLVDGDPRYVINAQATRTGVVRSKIEDNWHCVACLRDIAYGEDEPVNVLHQAVVTAENGKPVNLRKSASLNSARICAVPVGAEVAVLNEVDSDWAEIQYGDKTGYMMRKFLRRLEENAPDERLRQIKDLLEQALRLTEEMLGG